MNQEQNEKTIYAAYLSGNLIVNIKKYNRFAEINIGESDPYLMSIAYLGAKNRGIVFALTGDGFVVGKKYDFSIRNKKYRLVFQSCKLDTVEAFFEQFEHDVNIASYWKDLDYDVRSCGRFISHDIICLPEEPRNEDIVKFSEERENLSYAQKLNQQGGRRRDPIEIVLAMLHEWQIYVLKRLDERNSKFMMTLRGKKKNQNQKLFSLISDPKGQDDYYIQAEEDLNKIKEQLSSGVDEYTLIEIKKKLPKIKEALSKKEEVEIYIEEKLDYEDSIEKDLNFREFVVV